MKKGLLRRQGEWGYSAPPVETPRSRKSRSHTGQLQVPTIKVNAHFAEFLISYFYSSWDDQWPESEVWEMNVNSPARTINNNLGSDFTSNSNRLHWSGTLLVLRRRIDHHWKRPSWPRLTLVRQFSEDSDSRSESDGTVCVQSRKERWRKDDATSRLFRNP